MGQDGISFKEKVMYKKITHNITEEHFAHPSAHAIKSSIEKLHGYGPDHSLVNPPILPPSKVTLTPEVILYNNSKKMWHDFLWIVRNSIVSAMDDMPDQLSVASQFEKEIISMGDFVRPFYGEDFATKFMAHLKGLVSNLIDIAKAIRLNKDTTILKAINAKHIEDIAALLNMVNPSGWPTVVITERLTAATNAWIQQLITRGKKDYSTEMKEMTNAYNALLQSPTKTSESMYMHGLSDIFANGILGQFPDKFKG
jgi:hypothetical protein